MTNATAHISSVKRPIVKQHPKPDWSLVDMPSQDGLIFLITGGSSGIGYETAKALAAAGAQVIVAARNQTQIDEAIANILAQTPDANVHFELLDLADLSSVRALGKRLNAKLSRLDVLINNAGIMEPPKHSRSADGFEMQFACNYLGHFALTETLLPLLQKSASPRVVTVSSIAARASGADIYFSDLQFEKHYDPALAYRQSKLACLMFALELQRRSDLEGWGLRSIASHPGVSRTNLLVNHSGISGFIRRNMAFLFQSPALGALSTLYAATAPDGQGGAYYGPTGLGETRGPIGHATLPAAAEDPQIIARLWAVSEELIGKRYSTRQDG